jgi:hypothetical protein
MSFPDRKELIKIISTRYLLISLITRKYLVDMILINLSGRVMEPVGFPAKINLDQRVLTLYIFVLSTYNEINVSAV